MQIWLFLSCPLFTRLYWKHQWMLSLLTEKWKSLGCVWLCNPMDCTVHGILPGWNTGVGCHPSSRASSQLRDRTHVTCSSCIAGGFYNTEPLGKPGFLSIVSVEEGEPCFHRFKVLWAMLGQFAPGESFGGWGGVCWIRELNFNRETSACLNRHQTCRVCAVCHGRQSKRDNEDLRAVSLAELSFASTWAFLWQEFMQMPVCCEVGSGMKGSCRIHSLLSIPSCLLSPLDKTNKASWSYWASKSCTEM